MFFSPSSPKLLELTFISDKFVKFLRQSAKSIYEFGDIFGQKDKLIPFMFGKDGSTLFKTDISLSLRWLSLKSKNNLF